MVSFTQNGSEITTWMGIASKPKAQDLKQSNKNIFLEFQAALDPHRDTGVLRLLTATATFIAATMKKHI